LVFSALTAVLWLGIGFLMASDGLSGAAEAARAGSPAALTVVAATNALGAASLQHGLDAAGAALLIVALLLWLALLPLVLAAWHTPTVGMSFMVAVSTESLAVLAAALATREHAPWLLDIAFVPFLVGLALYVFVLVRFDPGQLRSGRGDHWVSAGAVAIAALAAGQITVSAAALHVFASAADVFQVVSLALWALATAWLPALVAAEARWPRFAYDMLRWSTVFPLGMYAACSFVVGDATGTPAITQLARVWVWVGVSAWFAVAAPTIRRGLRLIRAEWSGPRSG
jgi:hypothetical protein